MNKDPKYISIWIIFVMRAINGGLMPGKWKSWNGQVYHKLQSDYIYSSFCIWCIRSLVMILWQG